MKPILRFFKMWDFIWSVPLAFIAFYGYGWIQENIFGDPMYSTEWFHRAILASLIMILFNGVILTGTYFNFKGIFKYFYSKDSSIRNDFNNAPVWLKLLYFPFVFFLYLFALILVFRYIVPII